MGAPQATTGSGYHRERTQLRHFALNFIIDGPTEDGGDEPWDTLETFTASPSPLSLPEVGREAHKQDDGSWLLTIHFEGLPDGQSSIVLVDIDHAGSEDPVESFPKFMGPGGLFTKWSGLPFQNGKFVGWQPQVKDPDSGQLVQNPMLGTTHFLNDNAILRITVLTADFDSSVLQNICKLDTSLVPDSAKKFLNVQNNQSWLKRSVRGSYRGNVWEITIEWLLGIWAPDIYMPPSSGQPLADASAAPLMLPA